MQKLGNIPDSSRQNLLFRQVGIDCDDVLGLVDDGPNIVGHDIIMNGMGEFFQILLGYLGLSENRIFLKVIENFFIKKGIAHKDFGGGHRHN